jgi:hypothetical protein
LSRLIAAALLNQSMPSRAAPPHDPCQTCTIGEMR